MGTLRRLTHHAGPGGRVREVVQVGSFGILQAHHRGECVQYLDGGGAGLVLLDSDVVSDADTCQAGELFAAQSRHASRCGSRVQADRGWVSLVTSSLQEAAEGLSFHALRLACKQRDRDIPAEAAQTAQGLQYRWVYLSGILSLRGTTASSTRSCDLAGARVISQHWCHGRATVTSASLGKVLVGAHSNARTGAGRRDGRIDPLSRDAQDQ